MGPHKSAVVRQHGVAVLLAAGGLLAVVSAVTGAGGVPPPEAVPPPETFDEARQVGAEAPAAGGAPRAADGVPAAVGGPDLADGVAAEPGATGPEPRLQPAGVVLISAVLGTDGDPPVAVDGDRGPGRRGPDGLAREGRGAGDSGADGGESADGGADVGGGGHGAAADGAAAAAADGAAAAAADGAAAAAGGAGEVRVGWVWPAQGQVTSEFGQRWGRPHKGLDISDGVGAPVVAAARGEVTSAGSEGGYGLTVTVDHGAGIETAYAHLSAVEVAAGEWVEAGDPLGAMGCTGSCTGPHLHFEVHRDGAAVNPREILP